MSGDAGQPAALPQALVRLPAREHSNELYAATAAAALLSASGRSVKVSTGQAVGLSPALGWSGPFLTPEESSYAERTRIVRFVG